MKAFIHLLISTVAVLVAAYLIPGVAIDSYFVAFVVAIVLGILNAVLRPILLILTLPITILTLGFFSLVINTLIIMLADWLIAGFRVGSFWEAFLFGIVLFFINAFMHQLARRDER